MLAELDCVSPFNVTLHVVPVARPLSVNVTDGVVTVNEAVALSKLPSDPVAVTVYAAAVLDVIVTVQLKLPAEPPDAVTVHVPLGVTLAPELIVNAIVTAPPVSVVGVNPVPLTVTDVPLDPWLGVSVIAGVVPVNSAFATFVVVLGSQTTTHGALTSVVHTIVLDAGMSPLDVAVNVDGEPVAQPTSPDTTAKQ